GTTASTDGGTSSSRRSSERIDDGLGRDHAVRVAHDIFDLVPVDVDVVATADPPSVADVRGHEEAARLLAHHLVLHADGRVAPDGEAPVAVVVVVEHHERLLALVEEGRRAVAGALLDVGGGT